jgi:hypothetical protein
VAGVVDPGGRTGLNEAGYNGAVSWELVGVGFHTDALSPLWKAATTFQCGLLGRK